MDGNLSRANEQVNMTEKENMELAEKYYNEVDKIKMELYKQSEFNERYVIYCEEARINPKTINTNMSKFINYMQDKCYRYKKEFKLQHVFDQEHFTKWMWSDFAKIKTSRSETRCHQNGGC